METDTAGLLGEILFILVLIVINGFFAASEIALVSVKKTRIRQLMEEGDKNAARVSRLFEQPGQFLATIQFAITLAGFLASASAAVSLAAVVGKLFEKSGIPLLVSASAQLSVVVVTIVVAYLTLVFGELVPKRLGLMHAEKFSLAVVRVLDLLSKLFAPFIWLLTVSSNLILRILGVDLNSAQPNVTEEEIRMLLDVGEEEGLFRETGKDMINSIFEFDDTIVREVMTPRTEMEAVNIDATVRDIVKVAHLSRIPVYEDTIDNIVGIIYVKDLLKFIEERPKSDFTVRKLMRSVYFVPDTKKTDELFKEMQKKKIHMAIVIDEYGGTAGLVTIEDLLEEIVGNIFDEYDEEIVDFEKINDNQYRVNARLTMDEVNDLLGSKLPENEEYETLAGFVVDILGEIPQKGDTVEYDDMVFEVVEVEDKRIGRIMITKEEIPEIEEEDK